jgi:hypothetical protein
MSKRLAFSPLHLFAAWGSQQTTSPVQVEAAACRRPQELGCPACNGCAWLLPNASRYIPIFYAYYIYATPNSKIHRICIYI